MSSINRELQITLQAALREAVARRHAFLTVEHLLYALLHDERGVDVLGNCGANLPRLKEALERFFDDDLAREPGDEPIETSQTMSFHRCIRAALHHAESAEKEEIEAGDLLAALFQESDTHAVDLLRAQGISRVDVLRFISHGVSKMSTARNKSRAGVIGREAEIDETEGAHGRPGLRIVTQGRVTPKTAKP